MDPYEAIAPHYDREHDDFLDDLGFYSQLVSDGPVLELGVGTGRILCHLAASGLEVWGVDRSEAMLERARMRVGKSSRAHLVQSSLLDLSLPLKFRFVLFPLNLLWHLSTPAEQLRALRLARDHLLRGGTVVVDTSNPLTLADRGANGELRERARWSAGNKTVLSLSAAWDDEAEQILRLSLMYDEIDPGGLIRRSLSDLTLRYVYRSELELMLSGAGFARAQVYGSYDLEEYSAQSPRLIALATTEEPPPSRG